MDFVAFTIIIAVDQVCIEQQQQQQPLICFTCFFVFAPFPMDTVIGQSFVVLPVCR